MTLDDFDPRRVIEERIHVEEFGGFVRIGMGIHQWCFPTSGRELTGDERRLMELLLKRHYAQLRGDP